MSDFVWSELRARISICARCRGRSDDSFKDQRCSCSRRAVGFHLTGLAVRLLPRPPRRRELAARAPLARPEPRGKAPASVLERSAAAARSAVSSTGHVYRRLARPRIVRSRRRSPQMRSPERSPAARTPTVRPRSFVAPTRPVSDQASRDEHGVARLRMRRRHLPRRSDSVPRWRDDPRTSRGVRRGQSGRQLWHGLAPVGHVLRSGRAVSVGSNVLRDVRHVPRSERSLPVFAAPSRNPSPVPPRSRLLVQRILPRRRMLRTRRMCRRWQRALFRRPRASVRMRRQHVHE